VIGWSSNLGHDFNPVLFATGAGDVGSVNGFGVAGNGSTIPTLNLFNGGPGTISGNGFVLQNGLVPEPSTTLLIAVGAGMSLLYRSRQKQALGSSLANRFRASIKALNHLWSNCSAAAKPAMMFRCHAVGQLSRFAERNRSAETRIIDK